MMGRKTETAPELAPIVECAIAYSFDDVNGAAMTIRRGTRLRADHMAVKAAPTLWFDPATTPHDEVPHLSYGEHGVTTVHRPVPSGWRRDLDGKGYDLAQDE